MDRPDNVHSSGRIQGTDGAGFADPGSVLSPAAGAYRPWTVVRNGVGDYTITFIDPIGLGQRSVQLTSRTADITAHIGAEVANTLQVLTRTIDAVGAIAAADCDFDFKVTRNAP